jgi:hypothetical protein
VAAFYLGLLSPTFGAGRAPRIGVLQVLLLTVATGAFLWVWIHAHKVPNLILVVAGLLGLGVFVWQWGRRRD